MTENKILIWIIIFLIIVLIIGGGIYFAITRDWIKKETTPPPPTIEYFIKTVNGESQNFTEANYLLLGEGKEISKGTLTTDAYMQLTVVNNLTYELSCWSDKYYLTRFTKEFSSKEKNSSISKSDCSMRRIADLTVSHRGSISAESNKVTLKLESADGYFNKMGLCFTWSTGVLDVKVDKADLECNKGMWKNWTRYIRENQTYEYLPNGTYRCGDQIIEKCESTYSNKCVLEEIEPPTRLLGLVDFCQYTARTYHINETDEIDILVTTLGNMRLIDYLDITFFDSDERWDGSSWKSYREFNEIDIGAKDVKITIDYRG